MKIEPSALVRFNSCLYVARVRKGRMLTLVFSDSRSHYEDFLLHPSPFFVYSLFSFSNYQSHFPNKYKHINGTPFSFKDHEPKQVFCKVPTFRNPWTDTPNYGRKGVRPRAVGTAATHVTMRKAQTSPDIFLTSSMREWERVLDNCFCNMCTAWHISKNIQVNWKHEWILKRNFISLSEEEVTTGTGSCGLLRWCASEIQFADLWLCVFIYWLSCGST